MQLARTIRQLSNSTAWARILLAAALPAGTPGQTQTRGLQAVPTTPAAAPTGQPPLSRVRLDGAGQPAGGANHRG